MAKKPSKMFLAGAAREALLNAQLATSQAKKSVGKVKDSRQYIGPIIDKFPPKMPDAPCDPILARMRPKKITRNDIERALSHIESWQRYLLKIYDEMYLKP